MEVQAIDLRDPLLIAQALALASARALGIAAFLPLLAKRHLGRIATNCVCVAVSLPQACLIWGPLHAAGAAPSGLVLAGLKEGGLGAAIGLVLSMPYWALRSALTLVDNQRGASTAAQQNPSLEADASVLGELGERAYIACLIQAGQFVLVFDVLADSYGLWPVLAPWPQWSSRAHAALVALFTQSLVDALCFAGPTLLLLLLVELALGSLSAVVDGVQVYAMSAPIKSVLALLLLAAYLGNVLQLSADAFERDVRSHASLKPFSKP